MLKNWLRSPKHVATAVPSSRYLAHAMAAQIPNPSCGNYLELGAGTGAITSGIIAAGVAQARLWVVEANPELAAVVKKRFPDTHVLEVDARKIDACLHDNQVQSINGILSSLPMLNFSPTLQTEILSSALALAAPDAPLSQYTYGLKNPLAQETLETLNLTGRRVATVFRNIPPAHVWVYHRQSGNQCPASSGGT